MSKKLYSIFEIAGPIMVGPSSSHTAGACKLGQIAQALFHHTPNKVIFELHGSFGTVYKGHSTDRALLAGIMKFKTADSHLKDALKIAKSKKIGFEFKTVDLGSEYHPNTVRITLLNKIQPPMTVIGSSIGGGMVKIVKIDQFPVDLHGIAGQYKTLVVWHDNKKRILVELCYQLQHHKKIRVHDIQTTIVAGKALSVLNLDGRNLKLREVLRLQKIPGILHVRSLTKLEK